MATSTNTNEKTNEGGFKGFKMPKVDMNAALDSHKKNLEILGLINKMSMEVCNGITKLQTAFVKQMMTDISNVMENGAKPAEVMSKFSDIARDTMVRAIGNGKQISDMITIASNDITAAATKRLKESIQEAKTVVNKK